MVYNISKLEVKSCNLPRLFGLTFFPSDCAFVLMGGLLPMGAQNHETLLNTTIHSNTFTK